ncbi:AfsR/SARP family transcriptional regulator [Streptomyces sp. SM11]|uniref:AfsR/SARP family transcriptional regulator n=1 Tax=Streptomyces sp. SM11 TaxID=565557 RepID=UPI000CD4BD2C|nr:AfsR/SARP family transcriptional regulator [Streptomyces sp. SM11]
MEITAGIMGMLELSLGDYNCVPSAPKPKKILALLLIHFNQIVPVSALVEELWGYDPPASARTTLQTYILTLRKLLHGSDPASGAAYLVTVGPGYMLRIPQQNYDLYRFGKLTDEGRQAIGRGADAEGAALLREALALYRGPVLADVDTGPLISAHVTRLDELRLGTLELCIDAELRLGKHQALVGELTTLVAHHRFHENLHAQYMRALWRSGRRFCALEVYQRLRRALADELGMEPAWFLQQLQQAILSPGAPHDLPAVGIASGRAAG